MRPALRLLRPAARAGKNYLEPGIPTGITGLFTHQSPRQELIILYNQTLDKLKQLPEISAYRTATEALTKHRLAIVESQKPDGFEEWQERLRKQVENNPQAFKARGGTAALLQAGPHQFISAQRPPTTDEREIEWDGETQYTFEEGLGIEGDYKDRVIKFNEEAMKEDEPGRTMVMFEDEPPLTTQQVSDIETRIGGGLIEEVIQVAEGELKLVDEMASSKVWENLTEIPAEGQWTYFEREWFVQKTHSA